MKIFRSEIFLASSFPCNFLTNVLSCLVKPEDDKNYEFVTMKLPRPELRCLGRSCHRRDDAVRCRAHAGPRKKSSELSYRGEHPDEKRQKYTE